MRVFFIGNVHFSRHMLEITLENQQVQVVGVATKSKSVFNTDHSDLSDIASAKKIPYKYVKDINASHILDWVRSLSPDIIFCFGWSALIKKGLMEIPKLGVIGYHPAKLPENRGRHPVVWALALGLDSTASTFFKIKEAADNGDILSQWSVPIHSTDDAQKLYDRLIYTAKKQVPVFITQLISNDVNWIKQDEKKANTWRKRGKSDGIIDFRMSTQGINNLVRALAEPYVGAHINYQGEEFKVWKTIQGPSTAMNLEPGKVLDISKGKLLVKTGDGSIWLMDHEISTIPTINDYIV